jgi:hypothetical protein
LLIVGVYDAEQILFILLSECCSFVGSWLGDEIRDEDVVEVDGDSDFVYEYFGNEASK